MPNAPQPLDASALAPMWAGQSVLRVGASNGAAITALQETLLALGQPLAVDGVFGPQLDRAIRSWQAARGLGSDGVVGARTLQGLADALRAPPLNMAPPGRRRSRPPAPRAGEPLAGLYRSDAFPGRVAFTFDDGPIATHTESVLAILATAGIRATFFMVGSRADARPDLVRKVAEGGHDIGNHSWSHPNFMEVSTDEVRQQLDRTQQRLATILGTGQVFHVRPPYGSPFHSTTGSARRYWEPVGEVIAQHGAALMMWQTDTWDWKYPGKPWEVVRRFMAELAKNQGGAVLMHDIHAHSAEALPAILDVVRQEGLRVVDTAELLASKAPSAVS